jgi:putative Mg2+ transporter-C (MgtC) family protein
MEIFEFDWTLELSMAGRLIFAGLLGAFVGVEREFHNNSAGIRTYAAISMGACAFGLISMHIPAPDPTRIAAQIVSGIGFIGAGIIFKSENRVNGLTTAATIWATAAIGLAAAFKMFLLPILTALMLFGLLALHHLPILKRGEHNEN